jgi:hypothetical protein
MKKTGRKLTLNPETLRTLQDSTLSPAVGGTTVFGTLQECTYLNCSSQCFIDPHSSREPC